LIALIINAHRSARLRSSVLVGQFAGLVID
jgi:hypothetical protein